MEAQINQGWGQALTILGVIVPLLGILASWMIWAIGKVDTDIKNVDGDVKTIAQKMDVMAARMDARFESHSARLDQLYNMFVDLLKERK
jgi:hypothetical protein